MRVVAAFKVVADESMIKVVGGTVNLAVPKKLSDYDRNAIEQALRVREENGGSVIGITVGETDRRVIREALAMGLDEVIAVEAQGVDALATAEVLAEEIKGSDLIIMGESSTDAGNSAVPSMVGEILGLPSLTFVRSIRVSQGKVLAERDLGNELEVVEADLPAVISVTGEINSPRLPKIKQVIESSKKPVKVKRVEVKSRIEVKSLQSFQTKRKRVVLEGDVRDQVREVLQLLRGSL